MFEAIRLRNTAIACAPYGMRLTAFIGADERSTPFAIDAPIGTSYRVAIVMMALFFPPVVFANNESDKLLEKHEKCGELTSYSRIDGCFSQVYSKSDGYLNKEYAMFDFSCYWQTSTAGFL